MKTMNNILAVMTAFVLTVSVAFAASNTDLSITINEGSQSIDIVDGAGAAVATPSVAMSAIDFSFADQATTGTLGTASEKIRLSNPTSTSTWTVSIAATDGAGAKWSDGGTNEMDADVNGGGQLTIDPSAGTIAANVGGVTTGVSVGSSAALDAGSAVTLFSADGTAAAYEVYDLTGVALSQNVPGSTPAAAYTLNLTLTLL